MTQLIKDTWGTWGRKVLTLLGWASAFGGLTFFTSYQEVGDWKKAIAPAGVTFFTSIVQHLRSKPS